MFSYIVQETSEKMTGLILHFECNSSTCTKETFMGPAISSTVSTVYFAWDPTIFQQFALFVSAGHLIVYTGD